MEAKEQNCLFQKKKKRKMQKLLKLFFVTGITAIVLIVGTYAWFIGTGSVDVSAFDINISSGESLQLSLDGNNWSETLELSKEAILGNGSDIKAYEGNTNHWTGDGGLIPISSAGEVDETVGRLKLFGKSSISATKGGYHLVSTRINNYKTVDGSGISPEQDGYVAFDLFIKNGSGVDYIKQYDEASDEAIYLTTSSSVVAKSTGKPDYGIANSVRVAFVQIGRVATNGSDTSTITSINCSGEDEASTGLCTNVIPTIWEPNNETHDTNLISYFNMVCKKKSITEPQGVSYGENCDEINNKLDVNTYVVKEDIIASDNVDIYDGLNGFNVSDGYKLKNIDTFTDTMKNLRGSERPAFFKLAANSITKLRVYIYLEGQDVDNYDLISLGEKISINFGFTKDQLDLVSTTTASQN